MLVGGPLWCYSGWRWWLVVLGGVRVVVIGQNVLVVMDRMCLVKWGEFVRCNGQNVLLS